MPAQSIAIRPLSRTDIHVSALSLGGHHLGNTKDEQESIRIVDEALDGGITVAAAFANRSSGSGRFTAFRSITTRNSPFGPMEPLKRSRW